MLFNSYEFLFFFLPVTLILFFRIGTLGRCDVAISWLVLASLFFYAWWNPVYLVLILGSALFNYAIGVALGSRPADHSQRFSRWSLLLVGVSANLGVLAYFKYAAFLVLSWYGVTGAGADVYVPSIVLPLAISFFTFQQIAYLVDAYRGEAREYRFLHYLLFVTFFPQLIAGPIVHHKEMLPQFAKTSIYRFSSADFSIGLSIFVIGLFKKVILADSIAPYANDVFADAQGGGSPTFLFAWGGALAYTFQLYFDFSGYSDMAIGLARMIGIRLPLNFNSPYKSVNIIEFWRRWHITLSRFLRDYLYISLGGNRKGRIRRHANLLITMLLGGLWHGAGWTFVAWGGLHGIYLILNHLWHNAKARIAYMPGRNNAFGRLFAGAVTFVAVVVGWVFFRAESFDAALRILSGMFGFNGLSMPAAIGELSVTLKTVLESWNVELTLGGGRKFVEMYAGILGLSIIAFWAPNTQEIMREHSPALSGDGMESASDRLRSGVAKRVVWQPNARWAVVIAFISIASVLALTRVSEFLYFQF